MSGTWFVYGLIDPRTRMVFYVGQTKVGWRRPASHGSSGNRFGPKGGIIDELNRCGMSYEWTTLEHVEPGDESALLAAEAYWIAYGRGSDWPLTNMAAGRPPRVQGKPGRFELKLTEPELSRWREAADREALSLSELVRASVELAIARGGTR